VTAPLTVPARAWRARIALLFVSVAVLWGVPFALIEVSLRHGAEPLLIAWTRVVIGAAILLAVAAARGGLRGARGHAGLLILIAICDVAAPFTLLTLAQRDVASSLAGILVATTPLFVGALAAALDPRERPSARGWTGLLLGFAGVVALLGLQLSGELAAAGMLLVVALGYAVATLLVRRLEDVPPLTISAAALTIAAVLLAPGAAASLPTAATGPAWAAMAALGVLCTGVAFALYYVLIAGVGATRAALSVYLAPIVSVLTGAAFLGEALTAGVLAGLVLILAGSWLAR
jgi:drug/metabolite transporter (DMT)-like permease